MLLNWKDDLKSWPGSLPIINVNTPKTALVLIDMQNYYVRNDGQFRKILKETYPNIEGYFINKLNTQVIPNQQKLLEYFRKKKLRVIHLRVGPLLPDGSDQCLRRSVRDQKRKSTISEGERFVKGTYQHDIIEELTPMKNELILDKNSTSAFNSTAIDQYLRNFGVECLVIAGITTNNCVESTARDAADKGFNVILVDDACASFDEESHQWTCRNIARMHGKVGDNKTVIKKLDEALVNQIILEWGN